MQSSLTRKKWCAKTYLQQLPMLKSTKLMRKLISRGSEIHTRTEGKRNWMASGWTPSNVNHLLLYATSLVSLSRRFPRTHGVSCAMCNGHSLMSMTQYVQTKPQIFFWVINKKIFLMKIYTAFLLLQIMHSSSFSSPPNNRHLLSWSLIILYMTSTYPCYHHGSGIGVTIGHLFYCTCIHTYMLALHKSVEKALVKFRMWSMRWSVIKHQHHPCKPTELLYIMCYSIYSSLHGLNCKQFSLLY